MVTGMKAWSQITQQHGRELNEDVGLLDYWWSGLSYFDDVQET